ncbi:MAG: DUF1266 domain-containing protein, partial [Proteocatella sp.]
ALIAGGFFTNHYIFRQLKDIDTNRKKFINENYFNLHVVYGYSDEWAENRETLSNEIKEGLDFGWGINDKESYDDIIESFNPLELTHAWDICRIAAITKDAYTVGFTDLYNAQKIILRLGKQLLANYDSWEAVAEDFISGKLGFNRRIKDNDENVDDYSSISMILNHMDFLFNDKDSPFCKVPLNPNEDLCKASDRIVGYNQSLYKRAIEICHVYEDMPGWISHWVTADAYANQKECDFLEFINANLELDDNERFIFAHAKIADDPRKSDFDLILTTKKLYIFPTGDFDKDAYFLNLKELEEEPISFLFKKLYIADDVAKNSFNFDDFYYDDTYAEIVNSLIQFIVKRS